MNQEFEASNKRFEALQKEIKQGIKENDNRFEETDRRFDKILDRLDNIFVTLGHDFEEFNSLWLQDYFRNLGYPKLTFKKRTFYDENYEVFSDSNDVEVDVFNEKPLIIGEVTIIVRKISKVTIFLRKVDFLKKKFGEPYAVIFVTYGFLPRIRDKALELLENAGVKVYTIRQREVNKMK